MDEARVIRAERSQLRWEMIDLEALLPDDHQARIVWKFVEGLDLSMLYEAIGSREGEAGRPAADPKVLFALWIYATIEGVGSARELDRLVERDIAYRWLAGGVSVNYHGLADFRTRHVEVLDRLLSESVTALIAEGLVDLDEIALDGTKIRASAGKGSFASATRLSRIEAVVKERLAVLKAEMESGSDGSSRRKRAARERAARETLQRAEKAREALDRLRAEKAKRKTTHPGDEAKKNSKPMVSMTDPEARQMRFADGAVHAGYNAQIGADLKTGIVVAVAMTDRRNDSGRALPMVEDIARRFGRTMKRLLIDTNYATAADIEALAAHRCGAIEVYAPPPAEKNEKDLLDKRSAANRRAQRERESHVLKEWRARMGSAAGQEEVYRRRKRIELIHAQYKNRGFGILRVRSLVRARAIALWHALAHNLLTAYRLRRSLA